MNMESHHPNSITYRGKSGKKYISIPNGTIPDEFFTFCFLCGYWGDYSKCHLTGVFCDCCENCNRKVDYVEGKGSLIRLTNADPYHYDLKLQEFKEKQELD